MARQWLASLRARMTDRATRAEVTGEFTDMVVFGWLAAVGHRYDRCERGG